MTNRTRQTERGSALIYILIAIALLALLTVSFMQPSSQQTQSQNTFKLVSDLQSQVEFIRSSVQECVAMHFKGDATIDNGPTGTDPGATKRFPINPNSNHYTTATVGPSGDRLVSKLRCPGNPGDQMGETVASPGNAVNHELIFNAAAGKFLPPPPDLFEDWQWYNGDDGVFFWIQTNKSDAFIQTALEKLDAKYAECEADVIDARTAAKALDSAGVPLDCPNTYTCFRLWITANTATNVYNGDTDGDEAACP